MVHAPSMDFLDQAFGLQCRLHGWSRQHGCLKPSNGIQPAQVKLDEGRQVHHDKQIGIGHGELVTNEPASSRKLPINEFIETAQLLAISRLQLVARMGVKKESAALVNFRGQKIQGLLQACACQGAIDRGEMLFWRLVGNVLEDDGHFADDLSVVEFEQGHRSLGIDREVIGAVFQTCGWPSQP